MIKYILIIFLFTDFDTRMGNFHTLKQKFPTYEHCVEYVEKNRLFVNFKHTIVKEVYTATITNKMSKSY